MIRNLTWVLLFAVVACAPTTVTVPSDAPKVTVTPKKLIDARIALDFQYLPDEHVIRKFRVWRQFQPDERRVEVANYQIAAASRKILKETFERLFTSVAVMKGPDLPGEVDLILIPKTKYFKAKDSRAVRGATEALVSYEVFLRNGRGTKIGSDTFVGGATTADAGMHQSAAVNALILAMEDAANAIIRDFPDSVAFKAWRTANRISAERAQSITPKPQVRR